MFTKKGTVRKSFSSAGQNDKSLFLYRRTTRTMPWIQLSLSGHGQYSPTQLIHFVTWSTLCDPGVWNYQIMLAVRNPRLQANVQCHRALFLVAHCCCKGQLYSSLCDVVRPSVWLSRARTTPATAPRPHPNFFFNELWVKQDAIQCYQAF